MKEVIAYEDLNGTVHKLREACLDSDSRILQTRSLQARVNVIMKDIITVESIKFRSNLHNEEYIQHDPKVVLEAANGLIKLTTEIHPSLSSNFSRVKLSDLDSVTNALSFVFGRILESYYDPIGAAVNVINRITVEGREFNQPYYRISRANVSGKCVYSTVG